MVIYCEGLGGVCPAENGPGMQASLCVAARGWRDGCVEGDGSSGTLDSRSFLTHGWGSDAGAREQ